MKSFFTDFNPARLRRNNFFTYAKYTDDKAKADAVISTEFPTYVGRLTETVGILDEAMMRSQKSPYSDDITTACSRRMSMFRLVRRVILAMTDSPVTEEQAAAKRLSQALTDNRFDENGNMDDVSGALVNLVQDLKGKYADDVKTIGATLYVDDLARANDTVFDLVSERNEEWSHRVNKEVAEARVDVTNAMDALFSAINSKAFLEGEQPYLCFINFINTYIVRLKRDALKQKAKAPDATPEKPLGPDGPDLGEPDETEPSDPGSGSGETDSPGSPSNPDAGETEPQYSIAKFIFQSGESEEIRQLVGSILHAPQNTEGCQWVPAVPATMPAVNTTYNEVGENEKLYMICWYDKSTPVAWYELPEGAAVPEAPEPPAGCRWAQTFTVMPARDVDIIAVAI